MIKLNEYSVAIFEIAIFEIAMFVRRDSNNYELKEIKDDWVLVHFN